VDQDQQDVSVGKEHFDDLREDVADKAVRHRRHRFPARTRVVKARYDEQEYAALAAAAQGARLTPSGFLAGAGLAAAGRGPAPSQSVDRELLAELLSLRAAIRRYAVNVNQAVALMHSTGRRRSGCPALLRAPTAPSSAPTLRPSAWPAGWADR
jgi:hypothetical protein